MKLFKFLDLINQYSVSIKNSTHNHTHFKTLRQAYWYQTMNAFEGTLVLPQLTARRITSLVTGSVSIFYEIEMRKVKLSSVSETKAKADFELALKTLAWMSKHGTSRYFIPSLVGNGHIICASIFENSRVDFGWEHPEDPETGDWEDVTGNDIYVWFLQLAVQLGTLYGYKLKESVVSIDDHDCSYSVYNSVAQLVSRLEGILQSVLWMKELKLWK